MAEHLKMAVAVCLVFVLVTGSVVPEHSHLDWEEDLGADMCPECRLIAEPVTFTVHDLHEEDLGSDMCPEKGQPLSTAVIKPVHPSEKEMVSLVKDLRELVRVQQSQVDQLANILQQVGKPSPRFAMDQDVMLLCKEQAEDSNAKIADEEVSLQQAMEAELPVGLTEKDDQELVVNEVDRYHVSVQAETVQVTGEGVGSGVGGMTVARYRPAWSEHFSFVSAVKVDGEVSCLHVLPQEGDDGLSRYVVIGDITGRLYIFMWLGDLLLEYPTISTAPITSMMSYGLQKNETILVTGHADGAVVVHRIWETVEQGSISGDGSTTLSSIEILHALIPPSPGTFRISLDDRKDLNQEINHSPLDRTDPKLREESLTDPFGLYSVTNLEMYKVGKMRYTLVSDRSGKIQLFRDNGSLHGVAQTPSRALAFMRTANAQRVVFLTEVGVGSLDLRSMLVRSSLCEGLNTSKVMAYAFDVTGRSKAHGFTTDGHLVYVSLTGDMLRFECQVKKRRKVDIKGPFSPHALKGYLLAATPDHVLVYNTTTQVGFSYSSIWMGGPRPLLSVSINEIARPFHPTPIQQSRWPVIASNKDKLVVVGFGGGYVGIFRSNLQVIKPVSFSAKLWNNPILISALVFFGIWHLFMRKRESGTVFSPEYPAALPSGVPPFRKVENTRLGFGERESGTESRRFRSPTRGYVTGKSASYGTDTRNFRASVADSSTYSARREPLFASTQPVGESRPMELLQ